MALARLKAGLDVARDMVLSPEEADRKLEDGRRAINIAAFTRLAETKPDTVIEAARAKAQREVEAGTKRIAALLAGKSAKAFDPNSPGDIKLVASVHDIIEAGLASGDTAKLIPPR